MLLLVPPVFGGSAQWRLNPTTSDWNDSLNWTPSTIPNGILDTATFSASKQTDIMVSQGVQVDGIHFASDASSFEITLAIARTFTLSGAGILNDSGVNQKFTTAVDGFAQGEIFITQAATAGSSTSFRGNVLFLDQANAGQAFFTIPAGTYNGISGTGGSLLEFAGSSSGANGTFFAEGSPTINAGSGGLILLSDNATAGNGSFFIKGATASGAPGGRLVFQSSPTGGNASFDIGAGIVSGANGGTARFQNSSSAGGATFTIEGGSADRGAGNVEFADNSSADHAHFTANASKDGGYGAQVRLIGNAAAADAVFLANGAKDAFPFGSQVLLTDHATGNNATFIANGGTVGGAGGATIDFFRNSDAGNALLVANAGMNSGGGGAIIFHENSTGNTAHVQIFGNGYLDLSLHNRGEVTIGSLEGSGTVFLGDYTLAVGSANMNATFSGTLRNASPYPGTIGNGSLRKVGNGDFTLTGANTYTGATTVSSGTLLIDGSIVSETTVQSGSVLGGSGMTAAITVQSGGTLAPGNRVGILTVKGNLRLSLGASYLVDLVGSLAGSGFDQTVVVGSVFLDNAKLSLRLGFAPTPGEIFTLVDDDANDPVQGIFDKLPEGALFTQDGQDFIISYHGGDGNDVVVEAVPESETLSLFTLGVVLVCFRSRRWRISNS